MNLGISQNFGPVDTTGLIFPSIMSIDYIRVYQDPDNINYGCDPDDFPTAAYINECVFFLCTPIAVSLMNDQLTTYVQIH